MENTEAANKLSLMAVLDHQAVPRALLVSRDDSEEVAEMEALQVLLDFSLIQGDADGEFFSMHSLQQLVSKSRTQRYMPTRTPCDNISLAQQNFRLPFLIALTRDLHVDQC